MIGILFVTTLFINIILSTYHIKSRTVLFFSIVILAVIFAFGPSISGDRLEYKLNYDTFSSLTSDEIRFEYGYRCLVLVCKKIGLTYIAFLLVIFTIEVVLFSKFAGRVTKDYHFLIVLYSLFILFYLMVVIRYSIAVSIVLYAYTCLLNGKKIKFFTAIIFSCFFHNSAIIFFLLFFTDPNKKNNEIVCTIIAMVSIMLSAILFFNDNISYRIAVIIIYGLPWLSGGVNSYFFSDRASLGLVLFISFQLFNYLYAYFAEKYVNSLNLVLKDEDLKKLSYSIYLVNLLMFISVPLMIINMNYLRYPMVVTILNFALIPRIMFASRQYRKRYLSLRCSYDIRLHKKNCKKIAFVAFSFNSVFIWFFGISILHVNSISISNVFLNMP